LFKGHRILALIPLRSGSKSVKDKNLHPLGGKPLLAWPIEMAINIPEIDRVLVSTDSEKIVALSKHYGAEIYERPAHLATDSALITHVIKDLYRVLCKENEEATIMVLLEATSPFRTESLIRQCLHRLVEENLDSIATFQLATLNPHRAWRLEGITPKPFIEGAIPWLPRQQLPLAYQLNGAVYAFRLDRMPEDISGLLFGRVGAVITENDNMIDIDTHEDFIIANALLQFRKCPEVI